MKPGVITHRLYGIQGLRGLAVLMVFSVHLFEVERKYSHGPLVFGPWIHVMAVGLDIFLVMSGFIITLLCFGHFDDREHLKSYGFNRVMRVYPIYIVYTTPLALIYLVRPELFNATEGHVVSLWRSMLLIPDVALPLIPVAWTLHHELYFYLVMAVLLCFPERRFLRGLFVWLVVSTIFVAIDWDVARSDKGAFEKILTNPLNYDFMLGMFAAWMVRRGSTRFPWSCLAVGTIVPIAGYFIYYAMTGVDRIDDQWAVVILGIPAALLAYAVLTLEQQRGWIFARKLNWVGDAAYSIYLTHVMSIVLVGRVWGAIGMPGWPAHLAFLVVAAGIGLLFGWLAYQWIEKPLIKYLRNYDPARRRVVTQ